MSSAHCRDEKCIQGFNHKTRSSDLSVDGRTILKVILNTSREHVVWKNPTWDMVQWQVLMKMVMELRVCARGKCTELLCTFSFL
jgi:hypothetical protein